jgi:hypothetical protein
MADLKFDIDTMELAIKDGDFVLIDNPSAQNGALILKTQNCNLYTPTLGVNIVNSILDNTGVQFHLNRWKEQCKADGAILAEYTINDDGTFTTQVKYGKL